jgi:hypothetical protein
VSRRPEVGLRLAVGPRPEVGLRLGVSPHLGVDRRPVAAATMVAVFFQVPAEVAPTAIRAAVAWLVASMVSEPAAIPAAAWVARQRVFSHPRVLSLRALSRSPDSRSISP